MGTSVLLYESRGPVAPITFNRPERLNAFARRAAGIGEMAVMQIRRAIDRASGTTGMSGALEAALDIDTLIEREGMPTKRRFVAIARTEELCSAPAWRQARATEIE